MKAPYERLYCVRSCDRVVRRNCWTCLRVLRLLRVVFSKYSCRFLQRRNVTFARLAVFHFVLLFFVVCLCFNPTKAYADTYIGGPYENVNDAGLTYLGYDYDTLVDETKHTALNELVEFPAKYPDYTSWVNTFYAEWFDARYYWSRVDGMLFVDLTDRARRDVQKAVKAAEDYNSGSGGGSEVPAETYDLPFMFGNNDTYKLRMQITEVASNIIKQESEAYPYISLIVEVLSGSGRIVYMPYVIICNKQFSIEQSGTNISIVTSGEASMKIWGMSIANFNSGYSGGIWTFTTNNFNNPSLVTFTDTHIIVNSYPFDSLYGLNNSHFEPEPDPDPEPEPEAPTAPPETPTVPDLPDPDLPTEPDVPENPDLSDLLAALDEHCQHLQLAIYNGLDDYYTSITKYYEDVTKWLADTYKYYDGELDKRFQVLFNYLRSTNQYLKNIDNNVQEILDKLDGLGEQIGIEDIPDSYDANANNATQGSGVLANAYNNLRTKFPFSVIDNIVTLATSLKHEAVAPAFQLPMINPLGDEPYMIDFDFSDWSSLAAVVRTGEIVASYLGLSRSAIKQWTGEGDE